ncbi:MAG: RidA family protein [Nostochopsis sp.]
MKLTLLLILVILLSSFSTSQIEAQSNTKQQIDSQTSQSSSVRYLTSPETTSLNLPFSEAVRVGNMLYLSGNLGNIPGKKQLVPNGIKAETKQTMENIKRVLERNSSSMNQVVQCKVMLADIKEWGAMNEVYVTYFSKDRFPARSALGTNGLALNARVEIECMATVN